MSQPNKGVQTPFIFSDILFMASFFYKSIFKCEPKPYFNTHYTTYGTQKIPSIDFWHRIGDFEIARLVCSKKKLLLRLILRRIIGHQYQTTEDMCRCVSDLKMQFCQWYLSRLAWQGLLKYLILRDKGSSLNDVTQFWIFFDPLPS